MAETKPPPFARLNAHGEMELELESVTYVARPSREAIEAMERQTGRSLMELAQAAREGKLTLPEIAIIVCELLKAWGREANGDSADANQLAAAQFKPEGLKDHLYDAGVITLNARLAVVLSGAVTGGYDARGKAKPAWAAVLTAAAGAPGKKTRPAG